MIRVRAAAARSTKSAAENENDFRRNMKRFLLVALSSILLILSFPSFNLGVFAWLGLVPLFFAIDWQKASGSFLAGYVTGIIFFFGTVYWLIHVTLPGMIAVVFYLALYFGVFGLIVLPAVNRPSFLSLFAIPAVWVALEYARAHIIGGFGWNLLAHSQSFNLKIIQIADIVGSYGVSFLVVLVNTAIFFTIKDVRKKNYSTFYLAAAIAVVFLAAGYGTLRINNIFTGEHLKVSVVQGNIPQDKKWEPAFRREIVDKYETLTMSTVKDSPDLIIWPETSVPGFLQTEPELSERIAGIAKSAHTLLLVGYPRQELHNEDMYFNSAALFDRYGKITAVYDKIHLVPFGEFSPAKKLFSFVEKFTKATIGDFSPGKEYTVFRFNIERSRRGEGYNLKLIKKVAFSVMICFEDIFPEIARNFVNNGAGFLVTITNDAWFGESSAPYQHVQNSVFRAIENRVNVIRAANSGVSCFIDQKGRVFGVVNSDGKSIFVDGYKTEDIVLTNTRTFYTVHGDLFAYLCVFIAIAYIFYIRRRGVHQF